MNCPACKEQGYNVVMEGEVGISTTAEYVCPECSSVFLWKRGKGLKEEHNLQKDWSPDPIFEAGKDFSLEELRLEEEKEQRIIDFVTREDLFNVTHWVKSAFALKLPTRVKFLENEDFLFIFVGSREKAKFSREKVTRDEVIKALRQAGYQVD